MSDKQLSELLQAMNKLNEEITSSSEKARAFLVESGVVTPSGELTEMYQ